ncbi:MAG: Crp/Fnr family transcriptional regulator, partial [Bacteroidales bacterium]|nr:Crp/Fnr family transcriptional regulator [Bacteroidales bacterium]
MIRRIVEQLAPFSDGDWEAFWVGMESLEIPKGNLLLKRGQVETYLNFLIFGIARLFFTSGNKEYTLRFNFPMMFFNAYSSFCTRMPSSYSIEAITDIHILSEFPG